MYTLLVVRFWFLVLFSMQDIVHMYVFNEHHDKVWTFYNFDFTGQQMKMAKIHDCKPFQESRVYFRHDAADCLPSV